jgi:hypothetical protein
VDRPVRPDSTTSSRCGELGQQVGRLAVEAREPHGRIEPERRLQDATGDVLRQHVGDPDHEPHRAARRRSFTVSSSSRPSPDRPAYR